MPEYGEHNYWDERYKSGKVETFDWLQDYNALKHIIDKVCTKTSKILMLGCGNALISEEMYKDGYRQIYNIDISEACIKQMKERNNVFIDMKYEVMDATDLKYDNGFFDVVIDKSTIDALLCGPDSALIVGKMTKEVQRVLKANGTYLIISYGAPEYRLPHLKRAHLSFDIKYDEMTKQEANSKNFSSHHVYFCKKFPNADDMCERNWAQVQEELLHDEDHDVKIFNKLIKDKANELEGLSVKDNQHLYEGVESISSDDPDFLGKIGCDDDNDEDIAKYLTEIKQQEQVSNQQA